VRINAVVIGFALSFGRSTCNLAPVRHGLARSLSGGPSGGTRWQKGRSLVPREDAQTKARRSVGSALDDSPRRFLNGLRPGGQDVAADTASDLLRPTTIVVAEVSDQVGRFARGAGRRFHVVGIGDAGVQRSRIIERRIARLTRLPVSGEGQWSKFVRRRQPRPLQTRWPNPRRLRRGDQVADSEPAPKA
jgi:hypothetical protein